MFPSDTGRTCLMWWVLGAWGWGILGWLEVAPAVGQSTEASRWRRYDEGPLTAADFQGRPTGEQRGSAAGGGAPLTAFTVTEVRYDSRYQVSGRGERWTARLSSAKASAVIHRDRSWNLQPDDVELLDHEQGHFDATQILAGIVQKRLDELLQQRSFVGSGPTPVAAKERLEDRLRRELQPVLDQHEKIQREYDQTTRNGRDRAAQAAYRARQQEQLQ